MAARLGTTENNNNQVGIYLYGYVYIMQGTALNEIKIQVLFLRELATTRRGTNTCKIDDVHVLLYAFMAA